MVFIPPMKDEKLVVIIPEPLPIMVTSDHSMQHVCERLLIPFYDPETG